MGVWNWGDGTTVSGTDYTSNGNTATLSGLTAVSGQLGSGFTPINGSTANPHIADSSSTNPNSFTITAWINDSNQYFYTSQSITGPWSLAYFENNSTGTWFNYPDPMLVTLKVVPGGYVVTICYSEAYMLDNGMGNTLYSAHFRTLKFSDNPNP
jgi:hypothetical protein